MRFCCRWGVGRGYRAGWVPATRGVYTTEFLPQRHRGTEKREAGFFGVQLLGFFVLLGEAVLWW